MSAATHTTQLEHCNTHASNNKDTLLRYVPVIISGNGKQVTTYALIDEGSSSTFVDKELIDGLGIAGTPQSLCLRWTSNATRVEADSVRVALKISGTFKHASTYDLPVVHTVSDLALPSQSLPVDAIKSNYSHLKGLPLEGLSDALCAESEPKESYKKIFEPRRRRWLLLLLFWALWGTMLIGLSYITYDTPSCAAPMPLSWWQKDPLDELDADSGCWDHSVQLVNRALCSFDLPWLPMVDGTSQLRRH
uniref:Solute carrier family 3 member 2 N-terminal domain-containing protein n=1 Tax=Anopheles dirus TaxID=7168 RepID=A0A182ND71_9DIPT